ncbi:MAG: hypothetical protein HYY50_00255 [Candidatus Kerfeldbacteria bacterium]|nr:hypothetical protein [Candidatus Kerfeldbacteria bacterium]
MESSVASLKLGPPELVEARIWGTLAAGILIGHLKDPARNSGRLLVMTDSGTSEWNVGIVPDDKLAKRKDIVREKAARLRRMNNQRGDVLSWQSKDEANEQFGGAAFARDVIVAFTGLPQLADEAVSLAVLVRLRALSVAPARQYSLISGSTEFFDLLARLFWPNEFAALGAPAASPVPA